MKTRLIVFVLSVAILGGSDAALARGEGSRSEQPRATHAQQRDWGGNEAPGHRDAGGVRHPDRQMDRNIGHDDGWSHRHPRPRHAWSHRRPHERYAQRGRHYYPIPRGLFSARPYRHSSNGVSITFHGHF